MFINLDDLCTVRAPARAEGACTHLRQPARPLRRLKRARPAAGNLPEQLLRDFDETMSQLGVRVRGDRDGRQLLRTALYL
jgi:hypothetical protein